MIGFLDYSWPIFVFLFVILALVLLLVIGVLKTSKASKSLKIGIAIIGGGLLIYLVYLILYASAFGFNS